MKTKTKRKLFVVLCVVCALSATLVVPSYAATTNATIYVVDVNASLMYTYTYTYDTSYNVLTIYYSDTDGQLYVSVGVHDSVNIVYNTLCPVGFIVNVSVGSSVAEIDTSNSSHYSFVYASYTGESITLEFMNEGSTSEYYEAGFNAGYTAGYNEGHDDGEDAMLSAINANPNSYNLYSAEQYNTSYSTGVNYVLNHLSEYNLYSSEEYQTSYQDGYNSANALVGVANVGFTGIFNVFSMLVNQMGIFGVSLAAVIITAVIILIIYAIFKIVKG